MKHGGAGAAMRSVHVLLFDAYGGGGVARTVISLANHLAGNCDVELITLFRSRETPRFTIDPRVRVSVLHDTQRTPSQRRQLLAKQPSLLRPKPRESRMSLLTDVLLRRKLRSLPAGILLTTRPSLHLAAARFAPRRLVLVGQDHSQFEARFGLRRQAKVLRYAVPRLDAFAVLTEEDATDYRSAIPDAAEVRFIPNALPWQVADSPAPLESKVIVTAGRLDLNKGHARMVRAFATVAARHPDWQLHIYGAGTERSALAAQIAELGLEQQVQLMGYTLDLRSALADASVYALASHSEGFSMVLIEAMSVGLPPVAMDCPRGPRQIIEDGRNGMLVPDGDEPAFVAALLSLVEDEELRRRLGRQALQDALAYELDEVGGQWERLFADATARRAATVTDRS
ncbi:MAG: glycosyltransferase family 4 protein [Nocardioides sp.]